MLVHHAWWRDDGARKCSSIFLWKFVHATTTMRCLLQFPDNGPRKYLWWCLTRDRLHGVSKFIISPAKIPQKCSWWPKLCVPTPSEEWCIKRFFPTRVWLEGLISNSHGISKGSLLFSSSSKLQNNTNCLVFPTLQSCCQTQCFVLVNYK
jgi:hypothetical protein